MTAFGPGLPTGAMQEVGCYVRYTGRGPNVLAKAARDPKPTFATASAVSKDALCRSLCVCPDHRQLRFQSSSAT
jgi:hypothetical protein